MKEKVPPGASVRRNIIREETKNDGKRKTCLISLEVVSNLAMEVGHLKNARTNTLVRDTADYRLSSKQL